MPCVRQCIEHRLGDKMLEKTFKNYNTQKVELVNRIIKRSLPRRETFARNHRGRAHSAIHYINNGPGDSFVKLCQALGCPIPGGSKVAQVLKRNQLRFRKKQAFAKSDKCKARRSKKTAENFARHEVARTQKTDCHKNQLMSKGHL